MERELLLLGLLRQEEMHGYRLVELVERDLHSCTDLKKPTAYFLLGKLTRAGWVTRTRTREGKRPPKWVYRLTPKGEEQFQALLRQNLAKFFPAKYGGSAGLAFLESLQPKEAATLLRQRLADLEAYQHTLSRSSDRGAASTLVGSVESVHLQAEGAWLKDLIARLERGPLAPAPKARASGGAR